jgi:hypothetical protein
MTNAEYDTLFNDLCTLLVRHGYEWIVTEVSTASKEGRLVDTFVRVLKEDATNIATPATTASRSLVKAKKSTRYAVHAEYSSKERVLLLLDAIDAIVIGTAEIHAALFDWFAESQAAIESIVLRPPGETANKIQLTKADSNAKRDSARTLSAALKEIRSLVEADGTD